jgi:hypothetical protein
MQPASTPRPRTDAEHRAHLRANVQAAATGDGHPGDWRLHHFAVHPGPGDLMPYQAPDYIEHEFSLLPDWPEHLADLFGPDHASVIARRGLEAAQ